MNKDNAKKTFKRVSTEALSLSPSALITLYEIDVKDIARDFTLNRTTDYDYSIPFRFHNMENLKGQELKFQGKTYYSSPITANNFEYAGGGALPQPLLTITSQEGMEQHAGENALTLLKEAFRELNHLVGAKVTRIRTFARFLDKGDNDNMENVGEEEDILAEFPRDIYFIERKSVENKNTIQFELSSMIDLENLQLPGRLVLSTRCPWTYRGEGCCYEHKAYTGGPTDGDDQKNIFGEDEHLPDFAPPVANADNKTIAEVFSEDLDSSYDPAAVGRVLNSTFEGEYDRTRGTESPSNPYVIGDVVFITKNDIKYYFVCKGDSEDSNVNYVPPAFAPPNGRYWEPDQCSKTLAGCELRWGSTGTAKRCTNATCGTDDREAAHEYLPFGGFPGTNTKISVL